MFYDTFNREMILFEKCLSLALGRERKYFLTYVGCVDCESKLHGHGYIQQPGTNQCSVGVGCFVVDKSSLDTLARHTAACNTSAFTVFNRPLITRSTM